MELDWLKSFAETWLSMGRQGREPHAVLLAGPRGSGKRSAAAWMARNRLDALPVAGLPEYPFETPAHADLYWLSVAEDRNAILIEQIRELVDNLALTSYTGRGKVAVIEPANAMTHSAANALLKTLEEPPGNALLILLVDRPGHLPATILSRCQRLDFHLPPEPEALQWLERFRPGHAGIEALRAAGGAPLVAVEDADRQDRSSTMRRDFLRVGNGEASPVSVAGAWAKLEPDFVLEWLAREVQAGLRTLVLGPRPGVGGLPETVLRRMDSRNLFCYLDDINRLRGQAGGSFNVQSALEGLLIDWATGLRSVGGVWQMPGVSLLHAGN